MMYVAKIDGLRLAAYTIGGLADRFFRLKGGIGTKVEPAQEVGWLYEVDTSDGQQAIALMEYGRRLPDRDQKKFQDALEIFGLI